MSHERVLIVEDDEDLHVLYGLYLQGRDYEVSRAYNGKEAFDIIERQLPDVIVLDMIMPVMDGEEFFVRLRTEKNLTDIPVIIASVNDKIAPRLFELGNIHSVLKKPFTMDTLIGKIEGALSSHSRP